MVLSFFEIGIRISSEKIVKITTLAIGFVSNKTVELILRTHVFDPNLKKKKILALLIQYYIYNCI